MVNTLFTLQKITETTNFFLKLIKIMESNGNYADILLINDSSLTISKDKTDINIDNSQDFGVTMRIFDGEKFHVHASTGLNKRLLIEKANELSKIPATINKNKITLEIDTSKLNKHFVSKGNIDPSHVGIQEKAEFVKHIHHKILSNKLSKLKIINLRVIYEESQEQKIFVNRFKQLSQDINSCFVGVVPFVMTKEKDIRYHYKSFFSLGYEATDIPEKDIKEIIEKTLKISEAKKLSPGKYTCILSPDLSGLLAHESFGHGMESDTMFKDRAKAIEFIGKKIAPDNVSIIDNPSFPARNGTFFFDDEGALAEPTYLIKNGIVAQPITDMYSVSRLNMEELNLKKGIYFKRTANARAESYDHKCYARMSNTYFDAGDTSPEKMIKMIKDGLYLHYSSGGMEDPKGWHVQIQGIVAEKIKNGKLTGEFFYEIGMTGYLPTMLSNIIAVGNKLIIPGTGRCGKGHKEWVRVSEGGPHLLIKEVDLA